MTPADDRVEMQTAVILCCLRLNRYCVTRHRQDKHKCVQGHNPRTSAL